MKIGIAGVGRMGAAIAARLAERAHPVTVWNRTPGRTEPLAAAGARVAATPEALAVQCDVVITMLTDAAAIDATYRGSKGLLAGDVRGKLFIEMSTVRPEVEEALEKSVSGKGAALIECPVGGTVGPAKEGRLFGFVGGAASDVERARPILNELCRRVEHVGPVGAGASMKLAINLPLVVYWQALSEALSLVKHLNLDPVRTMDILADTSGAPTMLKNRGPAIASALGGKENPSPTVTIDTLKKDLAEMVAEARACGYAAPVTQAALQGFENASKAGLGAKDCTAIPVNWTNSVLST